MRRVVSASLIATCFALWACAAPVARAQAGAVAVGFRNELKTPVIVQGYTIINNMKKYGRAMVIAPGKVDAEAIPAGTVRFYTVVDGNRPNQIQHIQNVPIRIGNQDVLLGIRGMAPKGVFLEPVGD